MREDFQGDSLGQWASYPPAQDIGYEPSLSPTSQFSAPGGRSLMRVVKPNVSGLLRFGFIKRTRTVVSVGATIGFAYRVNTPGTAQIEFALAGTNGILYTRKVAHKQIDGLKPTHSFQISVIRAVPHPRPISPLRQFTWSLTSVTQIPTRLIASSLTICRFRLRATPISG